MERPTAFTLVEMMMALAVTGLLLAAVAVAMNSSFISMRENDRMLSLAQVARSNLTRIAQDIRTAQAVTADASSVTITPPANADNITRVRYLVSEGALCRLRTIGGLDEAQVLLEADGPVTIDSMAVATKLDGSLVRSVTVTLNLLQAGREHAVTTSASPRRNQDW